MSKEIKAIFPVLIAAAIITGMANIFPFWPANSFFQFLWIFGGIVGFFVGVFVIIKHGSSRISSIVTMLLNSLIGGFVIGNTAMSMVPLQDNYLCILLCYSLTPVVVFLLYLGIALAVSALPQEK